MEVKGFSILSDKSFSHGGYSISTIEMSDAIPVMHWRNEQLDALRQKHPLTEESQSEYFENVVKREFPKTQPDFILLRFTYQKKLIGYGGLVHINWHDKRAEVSFLLETTRAKNIGQYLMELKIFLGLIKSVAFIEFELNKITTESYSHRSHHVKAIEECGFNRDGILRDHTLIDGKWADAILGSCLRSEYLDSLEDYK